MANLFVSLASSKISYLFSKRLCLCILLSISAITWSAQLPNSEAEPKSALHLRLGPDSNVCGVTVPEKRPARKIGLIVWLHGGMRSSNSAKGADAHRAILPFINMRSYYVCSPSAFAGQDWLTAQGLGHIDALITYMLVHYPIDPGNITMVGVSDGSLGVIAYSAQGKYPLRRRLLISCYPQIVVPPESLVGHPQFALGTWDFLQGGQDRLFPTSAVMPYLDRWKGVYPNSTIHYFPDGEHDFSFYATHSQNLLKKLLSVQRSP